MIVDSYQPINKVDIIKSVVSEGYSVTVYTDTVILERNFDNVELEIRKLAARLKLHIDIQLPTVMSGIPIKNVEVTKRYFPIVIYETVSQKQAV